MGDTVPLMIKLSIQFYAYKIFGYFKKKKNNLILIRTVSGSWGYFKWELQSVAVLIEFMCVYSQGENFEGHHSFGWISSSLLAKMGFPGGSKSKESACNAGDPCSILGLERSPREKNGYLLQYSCLGNPMGRGAWWATVHRVTKSRHDLATKPQEYVYLSMHSLISWFYFLLSYLWNL